MLYLFLDDIFKEYNVYFVILLKLSEEKMKVLFRRTNRHIYTSVVPRKACVVLWL